MIDEHAKRNTTWVDGMVGDLSYLVEALISRYTADKRLFSDLIGGGGGWDQWGMVMVVEAFSA